MFLPNTTGMLSRKLGQNAYGEPLGYAGAVEVECGVVHLNKKTQKTTVRTDSSATRGHAEEYVSVSKILFPITTEIGQGDKFEIAGYSLIVASIETRFAVTGEQDHYEVDLEIASP